MQSYFDAHNRRIYFREMTFGVESSVYWNFSTSFSIGCNTAASASNFNPDSFIPTAFSFLSSHVKLFFFVEVFSPLVTLFFFLFSVHREGVSASLHGGIHPPQGQTPPYGEQVASTHPTGMHYCCNCICLINSYPLFNRHQDEKCQNTLYDQFGLKLYLNTR